MACCSLREDLDIEDPPELLHAAVLEDVDHDVDLMRKAAAAALAQVLEKHQTYIPVVLAELLDLYEQRLYVSCMCVCVSTSAAGLAQVLVKTETSHECGVCVCIDLIRKSAITVLVQLLEKH